MSDNNILQVLKEKADDNSMGTLLEGYEQRVEMIESDEYNWDDYKYEFQNDLYFRKLLEEVINDPRVIVTPEIVEIKAKVVSLDKRMMATKRQSDFKKFIESIS